MSIIVKRYCEECDVTGTFEFASIQELLDMFADIGGPICDVCGDDYVLTYEEKGSHNE